MSLFSESRDRRLLDANKLEIKHETDTEEVAKDTRRKLRKLRKLCL